MLESYIITLFNDGRLPKNLWTHQAHLIVGQWHLENYEFYEAHCILKAKIILLNQFHHTINDANSGYHETLTQFWLKILAIGLNKMSQGFGLTMKEFKTKICTKELPLKFYSKDALFSTKARAVYIKPDLLPIDVENLLRLITK